MIWIVLNIIFLFKYFQWIYKDRKRKLQKRKYWEKIFKQYAKEPILKGET